MKILSQLRRKRILILGSARSGTTWLSEAINYDGSYRFVFEPVCNKFTRTDCPFDDIAPVPSHQSSRQYKHFFDHILAGHIKSYWTDGWSPTRYSRKRIIKEVRTNLALAWFDVTYPRLKIIFLIRNPFAVTASRARTNGGWEDYFKRERRIANRSRFFNTEQRHLINSKNLSREEIYFLSWCIENIIPLQLLSRDHHVRIVFYEDLVLDPETVFEGLFDYLGVRVRPEFWQVVTQPSKTSAKRRGRIRPLYIKNWKRELSPDVIKRLQKCAKLFGVDRLYPDGYLPDKAAFEKLLKHP